MPLYFRKNNTTYHYPPYDYGDDYAFDFDDGITSRSGGSNTCLLCYRKDNQTFYAPCLKTTNSYMDGTFFRYRYDSSKPSLAVNKNGTTYHLANVRKYIYVRPKGSLNGTITYTRTKLSNGYYKVVFTIPFRVRAGTDPVAENAGSWRLTVYTPTDITCSISWGGTYSGTLQPSQTSETAYTATCAVTCTGGTDPMTAKDRWFSFEVENSTNHISWYIGDKKVTEAWKDYSIPAGTYTPSAFKTLIEQYITGSSRTVKYAFTVKVNNQTVNVSAGSTIFYSQVSSGNNQARLVGFGYNGVGMGGSFHLALDFVNYKQYCVWCNHLDTTTIYQTYENYPITIQNGGIEFN